MPGHAGIWPPPFLPHTPSARTGAVQFAVPVPHTVTDSRTELSEPSVQNSARDRELLRCPCTKGGASQWDLRALQDCLPAKGSSRGVQEGPLLVRS